VLNAVRVSRAPESLRISRRAGRGFGANEGIRLLTRMAEIRGAGRQLARGSLPLAERAETEADPEQEAAVCADRM
jgi:hypothetical protein